MFSSSRKRLNQHLGSNRIVFYFWQFKNAPINKNTSAHFTMLTLFSLVLLTLSCLVLLFTHIVLYFLITYSHCPIMSYNVLTLSCFVLPITPHCSVLSYYLLTLYCLFLLHIHLSCQVLQGTNIVLYFLITYSHCPVKSCYLLTLYCLFLLHIHIGLSCFTMYSHCPVLSYQLLHIVLSCLTPHCPVFHMPFCSKLV